MPCNVSIETYPDLDIHRFENVQNGFVEQCPVCLDSTLHPHARVHRTADLPQCVSERIDTRKKGLTAMEDNLDRFERVHLGMLGYALRHDRH